jgi:hypothetical protein
MHQPIDRKPVMKKLVLILLVAFAVSARADFTIQLDAGELMQNALTQMPAGSLLLLVAAGADNTFSNTLTSGSYVSGDDVLLGLASTGTGAAAFNNAGGTNETNNVILVSTQNITLMPGEEIALRWFPQINYTQFKAGAVPTLGDSFGTYNPKFWGNSTDNPDGGALWQYPGEGVSVNFNFFTTNSDGGGTQNPLEGYASFIVVPEPSTFGLLGTSLIFAGGWLCRRRRA